MGADGRGGRGQGINPVICNAGAPCHADPMSDFTFPVLPAPPSQAKPPEVRGGAHAAARPPAPSPAPSPFPRLLPRLPAPHGALHRQPCNEHERQDGGPASGASVAGKGMQHAAAPRRPTRSHTTCSCCPACRQLTQRPGKRWVQPGGARPQRHARRAPAHGRLARAPAMAAARHRLHTQWYHAPLTRALVHCIGLTPPRVSGRGPLLRTRQTRWCTQASDAAWRARHGRHCMAFACA